MPVTKAFNFKNWLKYLLVKKQRYLCSPHSNSVAKIEIVLSGAVIILTCASPSQNMARRTEGCLPVGIFDSKTTGINYDSTILNHCAAITKIFLIILISFSRYR